MGQDQWQCCCAQPKMLELDTRDNGTRTIVDHGGEYYPNIDFIILIQAHMRGKLQRMRYKERRNESRKKNTRFLIQDLFETINKRQLVDFYLLFDGNEGELAS